MKSYLVIIEKAESGFSAYVPDLPGCVAFGETRAETEQQIRDGIAFHIEGMHLEGIPILEPTTEALTLTDSASADTAERGRDRARAAVAQRNIVAHAIP